MSSRNCRVIFYFLRILYQIGIRCLAATLWLPYNLCEKLYQIGIRCLAATNLSVLHHSDLIISDWN